MAAATIHMSDRVLLMEATALPSAATVADTTVDGASTTSPGGRVRRGAVDGDRGDQRPAPRDRLLHRGQRHEDDRDPAVHGAAVDHADDLVAVPTDLERAAHGHLQAGIHHGLVGSAEPVARDHLGVPETTRPHTHQVDRQGLGRPGGEDDLLRGEQHGGGSVDSGLACDGGLGALREGGERGEPAVCGGRHHPRRGADRVDGPGDLGVEPVGQPAEGQRERKDESDADDGDVPGRIEIVVREGFAG